MGNLFIKSKLPKDLSKGKGTINLKVFRDARFVWATAGISCEFPYTSLRLQQENSGAMLIHGKQCSNL